MGSNEMPAPEDELDEDDEYLDEVADEDEADEPDDMDDAGANGVAPGNEAGGPVEDLTSFVEYMLASLVDDLSVVEIRPERFGSNIHIKVIVPESEMGKVIGRQGRVARSMRTLLTIAASRKGLRASLDIDS